MPLTLLERLGDEASILLLEPRRLAARAAAERLAAGLGEPVGERVGYRVRLESRISGRTRLEVVTAGLFLRRLQADPALEGVSCVVFDEFHERRADCDLALALVRQARRLLRPDLRLLVMSATLDLEPLAAGLDGAQLITSEGRAWPVELAHQPPRRDEPLERQVIRALEEHWLPGRGAGETVLVFLPGQREIERTRSAITETAWGSGLECAPLHGQLPLAAQGRAIAPAGDAAGKVVLATDIAESSLTIEGVGLVIDSGLSRRSRFDPGTGMDGLVTLPCSRASAEQRRGRAGRLGPGRCLRLWSPAEQQRRLEFDPPELLETDPLPIALQLAEWGDGLGEGLDWIQPPSRAALEEARRLLGVMGAIDDSGALTPHGRGLCGLGLHPRLGRMLLLGAEHGWLEVASALAVVLSERDPLDRREAGCDLMRRLDWLQQPGAAGDRRHRELLRLRRQWQEQVIRRGPPPRHATPRGAERPDREARQEEPLDRVVAQLVSWAYPERVALGRGQRDGRFLMRGGRGARLPPEDPLAAAEALAVATVDGQGAEARILLAAPLPRALLEDLAALEGVTHEQAFWDAAARRVRGERSLRLGALVLEKGSWSDLDEATLLAGLLAGIRSMGLSCLPWCRRSRQLQQRLSLAHLHLGPPWPDRREERLESGLEQWLGSQLPGRRSLQDLQGLDLIEALWGELDWPRRQELDRLLPEELPVPSGRRVVIDYSSGEPVLAVKLQEMFGAVATPTVLEGRLPVTLHLLSPAGRPAAITRDLEGFWSGGYGQVRRELRGRYPRHPWPEDPRQAAATGLTKAALDRRAAPHG